MQAPRTSGSRVGRQARSLAPQLLPGPGPATEWPDQDPAKAVERATVLVGPPLILTSVVLACGLIVTVFSDLPSLRLFGWLSAFSMLAALAADLLILRPTVTFLDRLALRISSKPFYWECEQKDRK